MMLSADNGMTVGRIEYAPGYGGGYVHTTKAGDVQPFQQVGTPFKEQDGAGDNTFTRDSKAWNAWHLPPLTVPANDNQPKRPLMVGLTGKRNVGKTTFADVLEQEFGFNRIHAFESGKVAAEAYFASVLRHLPDGADIARRMVYGDLKDQPSQYLPGNASPRYYMERTGHFHGAELGVEWTLGMEVRAALAMHPNAPIVVESVVYESPWFREQGGKVVRLVRPDFDGPVGVKSDEAQATLAADFEYSCASVTAVEELAREWARRWVA